MKRLLLILLVFTTCYGHVAAQYIKLLSATQTRWSGGVAGKSGVNYTFSVAFSSLYKDALPDTLWIGQEPVPLTLSDTGMVQRNTKRTYKGSSVIFDIRAGTSNDDFASYYPTPGSSPKPAKPHSPISYKGVALLSYLYNGRQRYYAIPKIMTTYPPVSYP